MRGDKAVNPDLSVEIAGVVLKNPVMTASGTFGAGQEYNEIFDIGALGCVTAKGIADVPWEGNDTPRVAETPSGMLNCIGLQNPGVDVFLQRDLPFLRTKDCRVMVNVVGHEPEEYYRVVEKLAGVEGIDFLEINVSCPNVKAGGLSLGTDPAAVEQVTEANAADPSLVFNVTMQNHGSYFRTYANFTPWITVNGAPLGTFPKAETYLSLIRMSDEALEDLLAYYEASDRDTVIVMFGDHQPTLLEDEVFEDLLGKPTSELTPEENAARYIVPYLIWANFDIDEAQGVDLSANYLTGYMLEACGIDPAAMAGNAGFAEEPAFSADLYTAYQRFLADVRAEYPIVTANFWYDNDGAFHVTESADEMPALLQDYAVIQYGLLFEPEAVAQAMG